jgi:hypothetical protein
MPEQAANRAQKPDRIGQTEGRMFAQSSYLQGFSRGRRGTLRLVLAENFNALSRETQQTWASGAAIVELFDAWHVHHGERPVKASARAESVRVLVDPQGRGRQQIAARLVQVTGTRAVASFLTRQEAAEKWGAATYSLVRTSKS